MCTLPCGSQGVANNEVLRSDSTVSLIDLLTRSLTSLELFKKCLKARKR